MNFGFHLKFAMNHVGFMVSPEPYVVQEALTFGILSLGVWDGLSLFSRLYPLYQGEEL